MQQQTLELRTRLRVVNIEHSRLLKEKTSQGWFARMGELKSERRALMAQLAGARNAPESPLQATTRAMRRPTRTRPASALPTPE